LQQSAKLIIKGNPPIFSIGCVLTDKGKVTNFFKRKDERGACTQVINEQLLSIPAELAQATLSIFIIPTLNGLSCLTAVCCIGEKLVVSLPLNPNLKYIPFLRMLHDRPKDIHSHAFTTYLASVISTA
jgi:hypothetical protein